MSEELKPCQLSPERAIEILWGEVARNQQPLHCTRKELCDAVEMAEESITRAPQPNNNLTCEGCINANTAMCERCIRSDTCHIKYGFSDTYRTVQQPNEPLTVEQLKRMDGEPVWVQRMGKDVWCMVIGSVEWNAGEYYDFSGYGKTWLAYRRPPEVGEKG